MDDSSSLISHIDFSQSEVIENSLRKSSIEAEKKNQKSSQLRRKQKPLEKEQSSHQVVQNQHKHDIFDEINQNDAELEPEAQLGLTGSKKIKKESPEAGDNNLHDQAHGGGIEEEAKQDHLRSILNIDGLFEDFENFKDEPQILCKESSVRQEEPKHDHLRSILNIDGLFEGFENSKDKPQILSKQGGVLEKELKQDNLRSILNIDGLFEELTYLKNESRILYEHHLARQEERDLIHQSLAETLCQQDKKIGKMNLLAEDGKKETKNSVTFKYQDFNIQDYVILEILGQGGFGLVIKIRKANNQSHLHSSDDGWSDVVVKLCRKEDEKDEKDFINEIIMLSMTQRAKQHSLNKGFGWESDLQESYFKNDYFKTDKYYGVFIKQGLGSLWDFKNYLKKTKIKLTGQELFFLAWSLLDIIHCLNKVNLCHRDIKPANIVIDPKTFSPELIDYGLASDLSKVRGDAGTRGYRMEDFGMSTHIERNREDQLVSNDYFALGKTILELAFPNSRIDSLKAIKGRMQKLKLSRGKNIIAEILKVCFFGNVESKKDILKNYEEKYFSTDYWELKDGRKKKKLQYIYNNFSTLELSTYARVFKNKYLHRFKKHMTKKWENSQDSTKQKLPIINQDLASKELQTTIQENRQENCVKIHENLIWDPQEQKIERNLLLKDSEKAMAIERCHEIVCQIEMEGYQTGSSQLYSTLMIALYSKGELERAVTFGKKAVEVLGFEKLSGVFLTNLSYLERQKNLEDDPDSLCNEYERFLIDLFDQHKALWAEDLIRICTGASSHKIKKIIWTQEYLERSLRSQKKELILADFRMHLRHQDSHFFMNHCYVTASQIDEIIDESTREKIKKFVYGVNISEKESILSLLEISEEENVLLTLMRFSEICQDIPLNELDFLKKDAQHILSVNQALSEEELLLYEPTYAMIGFIILYNIKYDLLTKFEFSKWTHSEEAKRLRALDQDGRREELKRRYQILRDEQDRKWNKQEFLSSTLLSLRKISGEMIEIPLSYRIEDEEKFSYLSILGQKIADVVLSYPAVQGSQELILDFSQNLVFISVAKIRFFLVQDHEVIQQFLDQFSERRKEFIHSLNLEFSDYDGVFSDGLIQKISDQLKLCELEKLEIKMKDRIPITDQGFLPLLEFISTQIELSYLRLEFNLCQITSKTIESFARALRNNQSLERIYLVFQNCQHIERKSIFFLLDEMKKLPQLKIVGLFFGACSGVTSFTKPSDLPFRLITETHLQEVRPRLSLTEHFLFRQLPEEMED